MSDIALLFDADSGTFDIAVDGGDLVMDDGLATAVLISLFTDARARDDDVLPQGADRRGWWGDIGNDDPNDAWGSRLWLLLERAKVTDDTALMARDMAIEALAWLTADQIASDVAVEASVLPVTAANPAGALVLSVSLTRPTGPGRERYDFVWDATSGSIAVQ